jgi:hypothetical protein
MSALRHTLLRGMASIALSSTRAGGLEIGRASLTNTEMKAPLLAQCRPNAGRLVGQHSFTALNRSHGHADGAG